MSDTPAISFVIPCYNEAGNLPRLVEELRASAAALQLTFEFVLTDDCSTDDTWAVLKRMAAADPRLRAQRLARNSGQSAALWAGMKAARGRHIVTLDADLQNDPGDLPRLLEPLARFDCVCGSRVEARQQGDSWLRVVSSRIANWVRNRVSGENISDSGCNYRAFRRECVEDLKFFKGMHRFLPTLLRIEGYSVTEVPIANNPRFAGASNYGVWNRLFASFDDLLAVRWMKRRMFKITVAERLN